MEPRSPRSLRPRSNRRRRSFRTRQSGRRGRSGRAALHMQLTDSARSLVRPAYGTRRALPAIELSPRRWCGVGPQGIECGRAGSDVQTVVWARPKSPGYRSPSRKGACDPVLGEKRLNRVGPIRESELNNPVDRLPVPRRIVFELDHLGRKRAQRFAAEADAGDRRSGRIGG
jgi:hypothetical protein